MENIFINQLGRNALEEQPLEICERKGLGHPDTICDSIMNEVSVELSKIYLDRFGQILHHNLDKGLLAAGSANVAFGGGEVTKPLKVIYGDRATFNIGDEYIDVNEIAFQSSRDWFSRNLRFIDPEVHVCYQSEIKPGSTALKDIFDRKGEFLGANDTSAAVGFAPMTDTERLILSLEKHMNSMDFKNTYPESGEDIKIMGLRKKRTLQLTVAMAFVDRFIESESEYFRRKEEIFSAIYGFIVEHSDFDDINLTLNALDARRRGVDGTYLTVLGTSAEAGDSGQVGRGNNPLGVIPLNRPMSSEAAAGKNPISHVGKIYNLLSYRIADQIVDRVNGIKETYVWLLSKIGQPINKPSVVSVQMIPDGRADVSKLDSEVEEVIAYEFGHLAEFCDNLAKGRIQIC